MVERIRFDPDRTALLVVDMQPDFMPGGALAVEEGDRLVEPVAALMDAGIFDLQVATQDWHPPGHVSFASSHPGRRPFDVIDLYGHGQTLWPDHCLQGSEGARLHPGLPLQRLAAIVRKGMAADSDSYSGFRNNWNPDDERLPTGLAGYLSERGVDTVLCCGLARDICVKWTAEDAADNGFTTYFLWDLTRSVDPKSDKQVRTDLERQGVRVVETAQLR